MIYTCYIRQTSEEQEWLADRLETISYESLSASERLRIGTQLLHSQVLDKFLAVKFATVKRYGGEGAEATSAFVGELLAMAAAGEEGRGSVERERGA